MTERQPPEQARALGLLARYEQSVQRRIEAGPVSGAVLAVGIAYLLRGQGGGSGAAAAQGGLFTEVYGPSEP
jgi:hypothetical protein